MKKPLLLELEAPAVSSRDARISWDDVAHDVSGITQAVSSFDIDRSFAPLRMPVRESGTREPATYLLRAFGEREVPIGEVRQLVQEHAPSFREVYTDPVFNVQSACPGDPSMGSWTEVRTRMAGDTLERLGWDGSGVAVALVDCGVNIDKVCATFPRVTLDRRSLPTTPPSPAAGKQAIAHGTMCAFDAAILAPKMSALDCPVALSGMGGQQLVAGILSDAILAFRHLLDLLLATPRDQRKLVVNCSWGVLDPEWDVQAGDPGNYLDNPRHPFVRIVSSVGSAGADVVFAAGNCGTGCPAEQCNFGESAAIGGANASPDVLTVGAVCLDGDVAGYSSAGPGRIAVEKPDILGLTHFDGSGVFHADGGTSAACAVVSGLVAALRSAVSSHVVSPAELRELLRGCCLLPAGVVGHDKTWGWGEPKIGLVTERLRARLRE